MEKSRKKELVEEYGKIKIMMGAVKITNKENGKIWVGAYPNLKNKWHTIQMSLNTGMHVCAELQKDWNTLGPDAFEYEVLEETDAAEAADKKWEVKMLEKKWLEILAPYGDKGYNTKKDR